MADRRILVWFSAGAASAVAAKLALRQAKLRGAEAVVAYTDPGSEHPDNARFLTDCEAWLGVPVVRLQSAQYRDTWQVWEERRYLNGPAGALCTTELKKRQRFDFQRADDVQVFGYTIEERERAERFRKNNPDVTLWCPLIDEGLRKSDCLAIIERAGIVLPAMYQLGYRNNNCIPCVKGGMGYWNKIRTDFPLVFQRMARLERTINASCINGKFLDELDPTAGRHQDEPDMDCSLLCAATSDELSDEAQGFTG
jgi:3'-phosphoadenosine 5'-phosphosulfate sulfotransferase (PAPS reductase)/FAD synthetase